MSVFLWRLGVAHFSAIHLTWPAGTCLEQMRPLVARAIALGTRCHRAALPNCSRNVVCVVGASWFCRAASCFFCAGAACHVCVCQLAARPPRRSKDLFISQPTPTVLGHVACYARCVLFPSSWCTDCVGSWAGGMSSPTVRGPAPRSWCLFNTYIE